jgi:mannose-6-phosphate isomerase-like protein (cupin superfamily)
MKEKVIIKIEEELKIEKIKISSFDFNRPWGGFFVIDESSTTLFVNKYFPELKKDNISAEKISPKILFVSPNKKLSWQYHQRRSEIWKLIEGEAAIIKSQTDEEKEQELLIKNKIIILAQGERHRLVGLSEWGIVAEIWKHTNPEMLSDENDIIRVSDDFGR